ncbi:hypothetical protein D3C80_1490550 [compost metagenome]
MRQEAVALVEPIETQGPEQAKHGQAAQYQGDRVRQPGRQEGSARHLGDADGRGGDETRNVQPAEIEDPKPGGVALARVEPDVRPEGSAPRPAGSGVRITRDSSRIARLPRSGAGRVRCGKEGVCRRHETNVVILGED